MGMAVLGGLAMLSLLTLPGFVGVGLFIFLWACSNVGPFMLEPVAMSRAFGVRHFATIIGVVTVLRTALQLLGPLVAGIIFDSTGKYGLGADHVHRHLRRRGRALLRRRAAPAARLPACARGGRTPTSLSSNERPRR